MLTKLVEEIERVRDKMHRQAEATDIAHPDVIQLSRKLDKLIVQYQYYTLRLKPGQFREEHRVQVP